ncbi:MAG: helix-turn-helix transcriptional regulator [Propionibacteriaceae bacterium]
MKTGQPVEHVATSHDADAGTRSRVLEEIMARGSATAGVLAAVLELTPAAVRRHLTALTEGGFITTRDRRAPGARGRGRPAKIFVPTDQGRAGFDHQYDVLAIDVLRYLEQEQGPEAVPAYARFHFAQFAERRADIASDPSPADALVRALTDDGFMASVQPVSSGVQLCQHHCPVAAVASTFPIFCVAETEVFSRLLGSHVQRLATIAHGDGVCTTHIPRPVTKEVAR